MQDSVGEILGSDPDPAEPPLPKQSDLAREHLLRFMPLAICVRIDDLERQFCFAQACNMHTVAGPDAQCVHCNFFPGVVAVPPKTLTWHFHAEELGRKSQTTAVRRTQMPLCPENASSLYSMQGSTAEPGMIAHWEMPKRVSAGIRWLIVYVMLSRVRSLTALRSIGLSSEVRVIEKGPPDEVLKSFDSLLGHKIAQTTEMAKAAMEALQWQT